MKKYWTKRYLYHNIDLLMRQLGISHESAYPLSSKSIAQEYCYGLKLEEVKFKTSDICGILYRGNISTSIFLNKNRDKYMQNFDCMHELIHFFLHDIPYVECICSDSKGINQSSTLEWQANEGAAQALIPYQLFIPEFVSLSRKHAKNLWDLVGIEHELSVKFNVSSKVINNRIKSLSYDIFRYKHGEKVKSLPILSHNQLVNKDLIKYGAEYNYCTNCLTIVDKTSLFCHICGADLQQPAHSFDDQRVLKGAGYMIYDSFKLDQNGKALVCPRCANEEINPHSPFCKICGTNLINVCAGIYEYDDDGNKTLVTPSCNSIAEGNQRYCYHCGGITTFYRDGLLEDWNDEYNRKNGFPEQEIPF